ncbi:MAG: isocitrate lyase/phosphoenolpyruvate mutase family protein [Bacteroidales bacterium]|nr:isocitrate lyase/phosphoenolpyruvate mutase family protein [Bacteroidales bacterium]
MTSYLRFKEFHHQTNPLLIGNVWNVQSAKVFEKLNFQAIGTSSAAIAHSLGYEDGQQLPFSELLYIVERIKKASKIPLTVDIENGYGKTANEVVANIQQLYNLGVVGINIEDSIAENGERKILDSNEFSIQLKSIIEKLDECKSRLFINVRCDVFLLNLYNATEQAIERIKLYEHSGADGIFLPCITNTNDIKIVVSQTNLPINVMCMPNLPNFETLSNIGVKRISMGNFINVDVYQTMENTVSTILQEQSFSTLF